MSSSTNTTVAWVDSALAELEPELDRFGHSHRFILTRPREGSLNVPCCRLHRWSGRVCQEIDLTITPPAPECMANGFDSAIPCSLSISASESKLHKIYREVVFEARPVRLVKGSLNKYLADALAALGFCTEDFISRHGIEDLAATH